MANFIDPINTDQEKQVLERTADYIHQGEAFFSTSINSIPVQFNLRGKTAGMFVVRGKSQSIRYNPWLFAKYFEENLEQTVPHEVAHYVVHQVFGRKGIKPHGKEWKEIMFHFGVPADRTCDFDTDGIPTYQHRRFSYRCQCATHTLTTRRHNLYLKGLQVYRCRSCNAKLEYCHAA